MKKTFKALGYRDNVGRTRAKSDLALVQQMLLSARKMAAIGERLKTQGGDVQTVLSMCAVLKKECTTFFLAEDRLKMRGIDIYADSGRQLVEGVISQGAGSDDQQSEEDEG